MNAILNPHRILGLLVIGTYSLQFFTSNQWFFVPLTLLALFIGIRELIRSRKDLKSAERYARVRQPIWKFILTILLTIILMLALFQLTKRLDPQYTLETQIHFVLVLLASVIAGSYQKFTQSIQQYNGTIKFPGWNKPHIDFKQIELIERIELIVRIELHGEKHKFHLNPDDEEDMDRIIQEIKSNH